MMGILSIFIELQMKKREKNTIFSLQQDNRIIDGDAKILNHATNYYKDLFGPAEKPIVEFDSVNWSEGEKVSDLDMRC